MQENGGQPMDENMIYRYIDESPFMDSSKNAVLFLQSRSNMQQYIRSLKRKDTEEYLKGAKGMEYMIVGEPQKLPDGPKVEAGVGGNGMWVIRKQDRLRVGATERDPGEVAVTGTYWINGRFMYQAPSIGDVIGCRLLTASNHLSQLYETASKLPTFDPERGYYYLPAAANTQKATSTTASATGTPSRSREGSVAPGAGAETQSLRSNSLLPDSQRHSLQGLDYRQAVLIADSFRSTLEFADDFMDENPLIGEPGNFTYTHSTQAVKKRRADAEAELAALAAAVKAKESQVNSKVATPAPKEKPPSPPAVMTEKAVKEVKDREKDRRGSKMEKKAKRKASRYSIAPSTPASATTSSAPNSAI